MRYSLPGDRLVLSAGVTNLFDKAYASYRSSASFPDTLEEGRSLRLSITARY